MEKTTRRIEVQSSGSVMCTHLDTTCKGIKMTPNSLRQPAPSGLTKDSTSSEAALAWTSITQLVVHRPEIQRAHHMHMQVPTEQQYPISSGGPIGSEASGVQARVTAGDMRDGSATAAPLHTRPPSAELNDAQADVAGAKGG